MPVFLFPVLIPRVGPAARRYILFHGCFCAGPLGEVCLAEGWVPWVIRMAERSSVLHAFAFCVVVVCPPVNSAAVPGGFPGVLQGISDLCTLLTAALP